MYRRHRDLESLEPWKEGTGNLSKLSSCYTFGRLCIHMTKIMQLHIAPAPAPGARRPRAHLMPHVTILISHFWGRAKLRLSSNTAKHVKKEQRQVTKKFCELKGGNIGIVEKAQETRFGMSPKYSRYIGISS